MTNSSEALNPKVITRATHHKTMGEFEQYLEPNEDTMAKKYHYVSCKLEVSSIVCFY